MTASLLKDAFAHHIWATERLVDACAVLTPEQLRTPTPGTYGSILHTFRHFVASDVWYLTFFPVEQQPPVDEEAEVALAELRAVISGNGPRWAQVLEGASDPDEDVVERGEGWNYHAPVGIRLAQAVQHGTDHRSQICTILTALGVEPPAIDLWDFGEATGRIRAEDLRPPGG